MQLAPCLLLALLAYVHGQGCSQQSLTDTQRVTLILKDNDPGNDGVTTADIVTDVSENYDINKDKTWTEKECETRIACRYGVTQNLANFICVDIFGGAESVQFSYFNVLPFNTTDGMPRSTFQQIQEGRMSAFASQTCVDRYLTVEEKVAINAKLNDHNDDNVVDDTDVEYDFTNNYDTDNNGNTTLTEFVKGVVCLFGDDGYFARYIWNILTGGRGLSVITNDHFASNMSLPIAEFKAMQTKRYEAFAASNAEGKDAHCLNAGHTSSVGSYSVIVSGCILSLAIYFAKP